MNIQSLSPASPRQRRQIEQFIAACGLAFDDGIDSYIAVVDDSSGGIIAGGGLDRNVIKCIAVADGHQGEALSNTVVSRLIGEAYARGYHNVRLFTKPANRRLFENLSFRLLAEAPLAILMETGTGGLSEYRDYLKRIAKAGNVPATPSAVPPVSGHATPLPDAGVAVMNANPFTLGHRYLIEQSSRQVKRLYVIVVREDCSMFSYEERKAMISQGVGDLPNVTVCDGSDYAISAVTFPTYFLKHLTDAADTQMRLDLDLYRRHIAPALGASVRFVGSEPTDRLTCRYNRLMHEMLGDVRQTARLELDGRAVSASRVRQAIADGSLADASTLVPSTTIPYLIAHLAARALRLELATTPKPGLVDSHDNGSHSDMTYALMSRSIDVLRPVFARLATVGFAAELPSVGLIRQIGTEGERLMFGATGGVNTHKGALFSMGLAVVAAAHAAYNDGGRVDAASMQHGISAMAASFPAAARTHGSEAVRHYGAKGALDMAREGYAGLFADWLPYYASRRATPHALHLTLLHIMSTLDDTNILHRGGRTALDMVKQRSRLLADDYSHEAMAQMNDCFIGLNLSPGGSADMLALTVFAHSVTCM